MKFLDDLRAYLERPEPPRPAFVPDVAAHRKHLLDALEMLEKQGRDESSIRIQLDRWEHDHFEQHIRSIGRRIADGFGHSASSVDIEQFIDIAIDRALGIGTSTGSAAKDHELDRLRSLGYYQGRPEARVARYALEVRAVRRTENGVALTPIGRLILDLPTRDAVRWMLAAESVQSHGAEDEWRLSSNTAARLLEAHEGSLDTLEAEHEWFITWPLLERLSQLGVLEVEDQYPEAAVVTYKLLPEGRRFLEEIASDRDTPFMLLARALLQDETASVLAQYPAAAAMVRAQNAATIATRHARMVAHEIRNTLVPVQSRISMLYEELERRGDVEWLARYRERIDAGIERLFDFVQDNAEIAHLLDAPADTFNLAPAIESAIAAVAPESANPVSFVSEAELPPVVGHRERFTMALANIIRNAVQARTEPPVTIRVTAGLSNGAAVFVQVDDDGPGVAPEDRASIFSPGFSRRPGGSGQGLAFVREVVEGEMAGRVAYEESPMGGARFIIRLPVGTRRSA